MTTIAISRIHYPVTTLGPGKRIGIWMQGCSIRCPGCISADTWAPGRGVVRVRSVIERILRSVSGIELAEQRRAFAQRGITSNARCLGVIGSRRLASE